MNCRNILYREQKSTVIGFPLSRVKVLTVDFLFAENKIQLYCFPE